jgi:hypothetical protein
MASVLDGTFDFKGADIHARYAPPATHALLAKLKRIAEQAKENSPTNEELLKDIAAVSPELAKALEPISKKVLPSFLLAMLFWFVTHFSVNMEVKLDLSQLVSQAFHATHLSLGEDKNNEEVKERGHIKVDTTFATDINLKSVLSREKQSSSKRQLRRARGQHKSAAKRFS